MRFSMGFGILGLLACDGGESNAHGRCRECSISVTAGTTIGELEGPGSFVLNPPARQDSRGNFYVVGYAPSGILVFDSTGKYTRTIGRQGAGPGEFGLIGAIAFDSFDTLYAFDRRYRRVTVVSPTHTVIRTERVPEVPGSGSLSILPDGRFVIGAMLLSPDRVGYPLHLLDRNFEVQHSFGADSAAFLINDQLEYVRRLSAGNNGHVWSGRMFDYVLELWSSEGKKVREIRHGARWLPPPAPRRKWRVGEPLPPPRPTIVAIDRDPDGYVWVLGRVLDENWEAPRVVPVEAGYHPIDEQTVDEAYDSMIEVFDEENGRLVASIRHPLSFDGFFRARSLVHRDQLEDGRFLITSYRLRLALPSSPSRGTSRE